MSLAIENYKKADNALEEAKGYVGMIGQQFSGGGGGTGHVSSARADIKVYFQLRSGDKNYHDLPIELGIAFDEILKKEAPRLLDLAIQALEAEREELAKRAVAEHQQLLEEAGLLPA